MVVDISSVLAWFIVGMLTGGIIAEFAANRGHEQRVDIGVGIAGAIVGGLALSLLGIQGQPGLLVTTFAAFLGAAALLVAVSGRTLGRPSTAVHRAP
jgi:uncharacterized membrane protein YeaQ/YmgE (transglycosylase-associated protein family)